jgi:uncharacterized repeat protein (TIGR04138 family)
VNEPAPTSDASRRRPVYPRAAVEFVQEALHHAHTRSGREGHVSGAELLEAFRLLALDQFGPLARTVLAEWGIRTTDDVGNIVFQSVEAGEMGKTDEDTADDFRSVYDFAVAFPEALGDVRLPRPPRDDEDEVTS